MGLIDCANTLFEEVKKLLPDVEGEQFCLFLIFDRAEKYF